MASDPTDESDRRAFEADIRNAALEEAAKVAESIDPNADDIAAAIRALKSGPATTATKPFTFADPSAQREWERQRREE